MITMASACINNNISMSADKFLDVPVSYQSDLEYTSAEFGGFEFSLENPVDMLPADELFSDGKLVPLHLSVMRTAVVSNAPTGIVSPDTPKAGRRTEILNSGNGNGNDCYLFSPKAPRCSSRWKELLGLRKLYQNSNVVANAKLDNQKTTPSVPSSMNSTGNNTKSIRHFLHRSCKSSDSALSLPLLKEIDNESVPLTSRLSRSSSSSNDHDELPRLSLDSERRVNPPRVRLVKQSPRVGRSPIRRQAETPAATAAAATASANSRGISVDSPRMNSSGKIIYHSLERSSSSPSSFNGGPRFKYRGMERSYSANVRVSPVLNMPVCSLRGSSKSGGVFGFPLFSSQQKRDAAAGGGVSVNGSNGLINRSQQSNNKNRTDRT